MNANDRYRKLIEDVKQQKKSLNLPETNSALWSKAAPGYRFDPFRKSDAVLDTLKDHISKDDTVLEIGGGHGILNLEYQKYKPIDWTILEPNPSPVKGVKAKYIKGFFDNEFRFDKEVDTVVHSHVFEHVYNPDEFVSHIADFLEVGGQLI